MGVHRATTWLASKSLFVPVTSRLQSPSDTTLVLDAKNFAIAVQAGHLDPSHQPLSGVLVSRIAQRLQRVLTTLVDAGYEVVAVLDGPHQPNRARRAQLSAEARLNRTALDPAKLQRSPAFDGLMDRVYQATVRVVQARTEADSVVVAQALASKRKFAVIVSNDSDLWFFPAAARSDTIYFAQTGEHEPPKHERDEAIQHSCHRFVRLGTHGCLRYWVLPSTRLPSLLGLDPSLLPRLAVLLGNDHVHQHDLGTIHSEILRSMRFDGFKSGDKPCFDDGQCTRPDCRFSHKRQAKPHLCLKYTKPTAGTTIVPVGNLTEAYRRIEAYKLKGQYASLPRQWWFRIADGLLDRVRQGAAVPAALLPYEAAYSVDADADGTPPTTVDPPVLDLAELKPNPYSVPAIPVSDGEPYYRTVLRALYQQQLLTMHHVHCIVASIFVPLSSKGPLTVTEASMSAWTYWVCALNRRARIKTVRAERFFARVHTVPEDDEVVEWHADASFRTELAELFPQPPDALAELKQRLDELDVSNWDDDDEEEAEPRRMRPMASLHRSTP